MTVERESLSTNPITWRTKMITFKIYQIKDIETTDYAFRPFNPGKFNFKDYEERYEMEFVSEDEKTNSEICEVIFNIFNMRRPADFKGHSLSVSDIVMLNKHGRRYFYYCDMCGFKRLTKHDIREW
jgi:hypothetical protein